MHPISPLILRIPEVTNRHPESRYTQSAYSQALNKDVSQLTNKVLASHPTTITIYSYLEKRLSNLMLTLFDDPPTSLNVHLSDMGIWKIGMKIE